LSQHSSIEEKEINHPIENDAAIAWDWDRNLNVRNLWTDNPKGKPVEK